MEERFLRTGAAVEPERSRRLGGGRFGWIVRGLARYLAFVGIAATAFVGVALLISLWTDSSAARAAALGLFVGGALLILLAVLQGGMPPMSQPEVGYEKLDLSTEARRAWQAQAWAYVGIGLALIGLGVLVEVLAG